MYSDLVSQRPDVIFDGTEFRQEKYPDRLLSLCCSLPTNLRAKMPDISGLNSESIQATLRDGIGRTVSDSSRAMLLKGILSVGPYRSIVYGLEKLRKGRKK